MSEDKNNLQQQDLEEILREVQLISLYSEKKVYLLVYYFTHTSLSYITFGE